MRNGVKQDPELLFRSFSMVNRFLPKRLIEIWLGHNREMLTNQNILTPDEYFVLGSNTFSKSKLIAERIPKIKVTIAKDKKTGTFLLEQGLTFMPDYDTKLEKIMSTIPISSITFDYTYSPSIFSKPKHPQARKKALKLLETHSYKHFTSALKDPKLIKHLKSAILQTEAILNKTKINSDNFSYMGFRNDSGFMNKISSIIKTTGNPTPDVKLKITPIKGLNFLNKRPNTSRPAVSRPQTSRTYIGRPASSSTKMFTSRPTTGRIKTALQLGIKDEPYHVLTLREHVTLNSTEDYIN